MVVGLEEVTEIGRVAGMDDMEIVRVVGSEGSYRDREGCRCWRRL